MNKSFLIALLAWMVFTLAFTFGGVNFITAVGVAALIGISTFVFFEYYFFQTIKKTEC